ncbi:hypothetical protein [Synechococcus sp. PCC 6312]|uniref:hypothetical protein n=1 Tax=Synechococcus sp. (strain ATCC 27167 / PCC 6312) TaxID=195253 RepID=UPI00029F17FB|nr:hypothetical protein [Synechococcus sp. PCC 6312]AFY62416.1 hypothetical protein Syn6312_3387 [Synechococcus sp. PCC 6312]
MIRPYLTSLGISALISSSIIGVAIFAPVRTVTAQPQPSPQTYNLLGITFQTPGPFSPPRAIADGVAVVYPPVATPGEHELLVGIQEIPAADSILGSLSTVELMNYLRYSLGTGPLVNPVTPVNRVMFGRRLQGEALVKNPTDPIYQEFYIVRLSTGSRLGIKLEAAQQVPLAEVDAVFSAVAASFQELEPKSRAWKQSMEWWKYPSSPITSGTSFSR